MSSIIINCFYRALTNIDENEGIKNLSVQQLTRLLVDQLYPEDGVLVWENEDTLKIRRTPVVQAVTVPVEAPAVVATEVKEVKVKEVKPKLTKEEKEAAKAAKPPKAPKAPKVKTPEPTPVPEPEPVVPAPEEPKVEEVKPEVKPKAAKAPKVKTPEPTPVVPAPEEPKVEEVKPKAAKAPKEPKAKFVGNLEKLTPTQDKLLKKTAADGNVHFAIDTKAKFIAFVNAMDNKDFNAKKLEEHMKAFFAPKAVEVKDADCLATEFKGKEYWVDVNNGDVYESEIQGDGTEIDKKVGKVGLLYFADMKMPVE
jgi:translation initiation factor 1 (eIF-1/SUI1)